MKKILLLIAFFNVAWGMENGFNEAPYYYGEMPYLRYDEYGNAYDSYGHLLYYNVPADVPYYDPQQFVSDPSFRTHEIEESLPPFNLPVEPKKDKVTKVLEAMDELYNLVRSDHGEQQEREENILHALSTLPTMVKKIKDRDKQTVRKYFNLKGIRLAVDEFQKNLSPKKSPFTEEYKSYYKKFLDVLTPQSNNENCLPASTMVVREDTTFSYELPAQVATQSALSLHDIHENEELQKKAEDKEEDSIADLPVEVQAQLKEIEKKRQEEQSAAEKKGAANKKKKKNKRNKKKLVTSLIKAPHAVAGAPAIPSLQEIMPVIVSPEQEPLSWQQRYEQAKKVCGERLAEGIAQLERIVQESDDSDVRWRAALYLAEMYDPLKTLKYKGVKDAARAISFYKKMKEIKPLQIEFARNALIASLAVKDINQAEAFIKELSQQAPEDSVLLWVHGMVSLLQNDQQKATEFLAQWNRKKNNVTAAMYELSSTVVSEWMTNHIAELHNSDNAMLQYMMGKMFLEGSEAWQKNGTAGWSYTVSPQEQQVKVLPLDLIHQAALHKCPFAVHYVGVRSLVPAHYRIPYLKEALELWPGTLTTQEIQQVREELERLAQEGNFAAIMVLAQDAYRQGKIVDYLQSHEKIRKNIYMTMQMVPAISYGENGCLNAMKEWGDKHTDAYLTRSLALCHQLGKWVQEMADYNEAENIVKVGIPWVRQCSGNSIIKQSRLESFFDCVEGLAYQALIQPFDKQGESFKKNRQKAEEFFKKRSKNDNETAYLYMKFLAANIDDLKADESKKALFLKLAEKLSTIEEYRIRALDQLARYYINRGDPQRALSYIRKIEEDPLRTFEQEILQRLPLAKKVIEQQVQRPQSKKKVKKESISYATPDRDEELLYVDTTKKLFMQKGWVKKALFGAEKACEKGNYVGAAKYIFTLIVNDSLLPYLERSLNERKKQDFAAVIDRLKKQPGDELAWVVNAIEAQMRSYHNSIQEDKIDTIKKHARMVKEFCQRYTAIRKEQEQQQESFKQLLEEMEIQLPDLTKQLEKQQIAEKDRTIHNELLGDIIRGFLLQEGVASQIEIDEMVKLPRADMIEQAITPQRPKIPLPPRKKEPPIVIERDGQFTFIYPDQLQEVRREPGEMERLAKFMALQKLMHSLEKDMNSLEEKPIS